MSEIPCTKCGEKIEIDFLHDVATEQQKTFSATLQEFYRKGCGLFQTESCIPGGGHQIILEELALLMGDDVDGFASMVEDFEELGAL